ncbi:MAG: anaerobic sulfatase maturase [Deltaproteobacteria bacterium]|nr:anaerobic sulfatase maturase [Deltaproteobacteria bacterium]
MALKKTLNNILVKPAGPDCNMACRYCFYCEKANLFPSPATHRMNEDILEEMIKQLMQQGSSQVAVSWQGGEPTLMGIPFFEKAVDLMQRYGRGQEVGNGFQTNGILIDGEWARFFRKYSFLVGLSIDGPEHVHDKYRRMAGGKGTWAKVSDTARMLQDEGVSVNALSVVNDYSVRYPKEIYQYLKDIGFEYMQFIPCVEPDPLDPENPASFSVLPEAYGRFLCTLFDLWLADFKDNLPTTSVRFFESLLYSYADYEPPECTLQQECGGYLVVEHNGDVYSCDFFVDPEWRLGNVMEGSLVAMLNSQKQLEFGKIKAQFAEQCSNCEWLLYCRGGCPKDRRLPVNRGVSHFCESYKIFFQHADRKFKQLIKQREKRQKEEEKEEERLSLGNTGKVGRNEPCPCGSGRKYKKCCGGK